MGMAHIFSDAHNYTYNHNTRMIPGSNNSLLGLFEYRKTFNLDNVAREGPYPHKLDRTITMAGSWDSLIQSFQITAECSAIYDTNYY